MTKLLLVLLLALLFGGKMFAQNTNNLLRRTSEREKVQEVFNSFIDVQEEGDVDGYFNHITDDFIAYKASVGLVNYLDALRKQLTQFFCRQCI